MPVFQRKACGTVEASQWFPPGDARHDPAMLSHRKGNAVQPPDYRQVGDLYQFSTIPGMGDDVFFLKRQHDQLRVFPGDWIVRANGLVWVVECAVFEALYEPTDHPKTAA